MSSSVYYITETPQAVFPDGLQEDFLITNTGITSVYLDEDSSISSRSLRLRPMSTMVWQGGRPLWTLSATPPTYSNGNSVPISNITEAISSAQITVSRNEQAFNSISNNYTQPIASINSFDPGAGASAHIRFDNLEVGHLETVVLSFDTPDQVWSSGKQLGIWLIWSDENTDTSTLQTSDQPPLMIQKLLTWYPNPAAPYLGKAVVSIPVRGPRLAILLLPTDAVETRIGNLRLYGTSLKSKIQIAGLFGYIQAYSPTISSGIAGTSSDMVAYANIYDFQPVYFTAPSSRLRIGLRCPAVTTAGNLVMTAGGSWYANYAVPVGAVNALHVFDVDVPVDMPITLTSTTIPVPAPNGANYSLTLLFKGAASLDYF